MNIIKIIVDILLLIIAFLLESIDITGSLIHEILGIIIGVLLIIHIITNFKWIKNITKNITKVNTKTKLTYIIDILVMISYFVSIILGILISNEIFKFKTSSNFTLILLHSIFGRISLIFMFIHLGIHIPFILNKINIKNKTIKNIILIIYIIISIILSIYSIYKLTHSFTWVSAFSLFK